MVLTAGNINDTTMFSAVLDTIVVPRNGRAGRPRKRPDRVLADKGYSSRANRHSAPHQRDPAHDPRAEGPESQPDAPRQQGRTTGRLRLDTYRHRNTVVRCFNRLKQWRGVAMRSDKHAHNYEGGLILASVVLWGRTRSIRHGLAQSPKDGLLHFGGKIGDPTGSRLAEQAYLRTYMLSGHSPYGARDEQQVTEGVTIGTDLASADPVVRAVDLELPGINGLDLELDRYYSSLTGQPSQVLSFGWSYDLLDTGVHQTAGGSYVVTGIDGQQLVFRRTNSGFAAPTGSDMTRELTTRGTTRTRLLEVDLAAHLEIWKVLVVG